MSMILSDPVRAMDPLRVEAALDREVAGIAFDSRRVLPGMVFVAIRGRNSDGYEHIGAAVDRGACAIVAERNGFVSRRAAKVKVADARLAMARAAAVFYGRPSRELRVAGVTGTNGKTVVAFLAQHLLRSGDEPVGLISTVRYEVGSRTIPAQRTTPEAVDLQSMLAQMRRSGCGTCVLEVSSHALDQRRVEEVAFDVGVFTNLTRDHLDYHGSLESYYGAKLRLFELLRASGKASTAVMNVDDEHAGRLMHDTEGLARLTFGFGPGAEVRGTVLEMRANGSVMRVETPWGSAQIRLPLIGRFNAANALAALATGLVMGRGLERLAAALEGVQQVPGRLERVDLGQPFGVLVDYAHTADALMKVLAGLREMTAGKLRVVFGCGGGRDPARRAAMGRVAGEWADEVWVTSDNPRGESAEAIATAIESGLREVGRAVWRVELDRARAIAEAVGAAASGDTVLIAGKGHETFQEFGGTVVPFDDRQQVMEALAGRRGDGGLPGLGGGRDVWR